MHLINLPISFTYTAGLSPSGKSSFYHSTPQKITNGFRVDFTYLMNNFSPGGPADGFAFVVQKQGPNAIGSLGKKIIIIIFNEASKIINYIFCLKKGD